MAFKPSPWLVVGALMLGSCDTGTPTPSPAPTATATATATPTPSPSASVSPTPTPSPNSSLLDLHANQTFTTSEAALIYTYAGGSWSIMLDGSNPPVQPRIGSVLSYTFANDSYTYDARDGRNGPYSKTFAPGNIVTSSNNCGSNIFVGPCGPTAQYTNYATSDTSYTYYLSRFNAGPGNTLLQLTYATFGLFARNAFQTSILTTYRDSRPFAYGFATPSTVSLTGSPVYSGVFIGEGAGIGPSSNNRDDNHYSLNGSFQLTPNFGAGTASLTLNINAAPYGCRATCVAGYSTTYNVAGVISSGVAIFALPGSGSARFFVAGPAGQEIAGSFLFADAIPNRPNHNITAVGAGAGKR